MTEAPRTPAAPDFRAHFAAHALGFSMVGLAASAAETLCVATRTSDGGFGFILGVFAQIALVSLCGALLTSVASLAFTNGLAKVRQQGLLGGCDGYRQLDVMAAALCAAPIAVLSLCAALLTLSGELRNRELAALAGALVSLAAAGLAALLWVQLLLAARALRARLPEAASVLLLLPGALLSVAAAAWLFAYAGLKQLDPWLLAAPSAAIAATPGALRLSRVPSKHGACPKALVLLVSGTLLATLASLLTPATPAKIYRAGAWSRPAIATLRRLTDFDRDGYSGWFGGGDCAPFDARVHPGAREIPRDGIDNNCVGGDGGKPRPAARLRPAQRAPKGTGTQLNLVLVTIETLRGDHVSFLGYPRPTTPKLDELAKSSVVFERSYATTPTTRLSLAALFSSLLPSAIEWQNQGRDRQMRHIAPNTPWLPALLAEQGYFTLAVHTNFRAFTAVENAGFDRGFARYDTSTVLSYSGGTMHGFPGGAQVDRALSLLDERAGRPVFLWLHLLEPHYLYEQSPDVPSFGSDELAQYDAEIAEADRQIGRLVAGLEARNLFDSSVLLVSGDHGEEFGEHGQRWHGSNLYEPQLRTATLLRVPGLGARRVHEATSFLDLAPTVLDLLGIEGGFEQAMGRDLVPTLRDGRPLQPGFLVENFKVDDGSQALLGVVDFPFKLVRTGADERMELYDLSRDPGETKNLWLPGEPVSRKLADRLYEYLESGSARSADRNESP